MTHTTGDWKALANALLEPPRRCPDEYHALAISEEWLLVCRRCPAVFTLQQWLDGAFRPFKLSLWDEAPRP